MQEPPPCLEYIQTPDVNPTLNTSAQIKIKKGKKQKKKSPPKLNGYRHLVLSLIFDDKLKSWSEFYFSLKVGSITTLKVEFNFDICF